MCPATISPALPEANLTPTLAKEVTLPRLGQSEPLIPLDTVIGPEAEVGLKPNQSHVFPRFFN